MAQKHLIFHCISHGCCKMLKKAKPEVRAVRATADGERAETVNALSVHSRLALQ